MKQNPLVSTTRAPEAAVSSLTSSASSSSYSSSPSSPSSFVSYKAGQQGPVTSKVVRSRSRARANSTRTSTSTNPSGVVLLVIIRRLLILPFFVLISTTCCTTTTVSSLSPLGLYKVGIGATNLVDNILGYGVKGSKTSSSSSDSSSINQSSKNKVENKRNNKSKNNNNNNNTNKKKRRNKNKNSIKRSNSDSKKKEKGILAITEAHTTSSSSNNSNNNKVDNKVDNKIALKNNKDKDNKNDEMMQQRQQRLIPGLSEEDQKFLDRVQASARTVQNWDADEELLQKCRLQIPWKELIDDDEDDDDNDNDENKEKSGSRYSDADVDRFLHCGIGGGDSNALFLQRLCRWFPTFMSWVNAPPCKVCGSKNCEMKTVRGPETTDELEGQAKRVEVYYCPECKANTTTFPRYNKAGKLLETRQGRCGEYSNLFGLFCRSVGFETRLVLDWSDHLWTEVRLGDSWIMADACEGVIDKPSMYEDGWGKDGLCYMIGIGRDHVVDVTPRYTRQFIRDEFQTRRRGHTTSEDSSDRILRKLNEHMKIQPTTLAKSRVEELTKRQNIEDAELRQYKQATDWTDQEKYGSGRISGSLAWKRSRQEAGSAQRQQSQSSQSTTNSTNNNLDCEVAGFPVEAFIPARLENGKISFQLRARPSSRHDGIVVSNTSCAVGVKNSISVVVVDDSDKSFGCILQSKSFVDWPRLVEFLDYLPAGRIVLMNGRIEIGNETKPEDFYKEVDIARLGGWNGKEVAKKGVLFAGQIDAHPDWTYCKPLEDNDDNNKIRNGYEVEIKAEDGGNGSGGILAGRRLRTERTSFPQRIAGRLPEAFMPLIQQNYANEKEKREAYLKFAESHDGRYCGYTTKKESPVYLLDSTAYPLQRIESVAADVLGKDHTWNTFLELPEPLVPSTDCGIEDAPSGDTSGPIYDVPLDSAFFNSTLGPNLLSNVNLKKDTAHTLTNARLIGLYFSAHWCGPCRSFTPMLAEMYDHLTETYPTHGLEIVFVSGDRDEQSFKQYYQTMPWKAIPFDQLQFVKQALNMTYGVRGIPSFVVLDAVSGQVVVSANESRQEVVTACRGGDLRIEAMFQSWLGRTPASTKELLSMIELSAREIEQNTNDEKDIYSDKNPYLKRMLYTSKKDDCKDLSIRIKAEFEKLGKAGRDPNTAAATALTIVSETSLKENVAFIAPGRLDGKATYAGQSRSRSRDIVDQALAYALDRNSASAVSDVLSIALKYLKNSKKAPWEPKYRSFKLSNKVADTVTRVEGGLGLLQALGFEVIGTSRDFKASIPVAADLVAMDERIAQLIEDMDTK